MNIHELRQLIRDEIERHVESADEFRTSSPPPTQIMQSPGAPYGGNIAIHGLRIMSNEARSYLTDWAKLTRMAWKRYGAPDNWPEKITQACIALGRKFEDTHTKTTSPSQSPLSPNFLP